MQSMKFEYGFEAPYYPFICIRRLFFLILCIIFSII